MKQKTIGLNPLEAYLSSKGSKEAEKTEPQEVKEEVPLATAPGSQMVISGALEAEERLAPGAKQRITLHISAEIVDRVKNAVYWEPGLTVAGFAEEALERAINELEAQKGTPFPQRKLHRLRGGRPLV